MLDLDNAFWNNINEVSKLNYEQIKEKLCNFSKYKEKYYDLRSLNLYNNETFLFLTKIALQNNDIYLIINLLKNILKNKNYHLNNSAYNIDIILNNICKYGIGKENLIFNFLSFIGDNLKQDYYLMRKIYINCQHLLMICNENYNINKFNNKFYEILNLNYDNLIIELFKLKAANLLFNYQNNFSKDKNLEYININNENIIDNSLNDDNIIIGCFLEDKFINFLFKHPDLLEKIFFSDFYLDGEENILKNGFKQGLELMNYFTNYDINLFFKKLYEINENLTIKIIISFLNNKGNKLFFDYYFIKVNNPELNNLLIKILTQIKENLTYHIYQENKFLNIKEINKILKKINKNNDKNA